MSVAYVGYTHAASRGQICSSVGRAKRFQTLLRAQAMEVKQLGVVRQGGSGVLAAQLLRIEERKAFLAVSTADGQTAVWSIDNKAGKGVVARECSLHGDAKRPVFSLWSPCLTSGVPKEEAAEVVILGGAFERCVKAWRLSWRGTADDRGADEHRVVVSDYLRTVERVMSGHTGWVRAIAVMEGTDCDSQSARQSGGLLVFSCACNFVKVWRCPRPLDRLSTDQVIHVGDLRIFKGDILSLAIHQARLYAGVADGSICVWDIDESLRQDEWAFRQRRGAHDGRVTSLAHAGPHLISSGLDGVVRVWADDQASAAGPHAAECLHEVQVNREGVAPALATFNRSDRDDWLLFTAYATVPGDVVAWVKDEHGALRHHGHVGVVAGGARTINCARCGDEDRLLLLVGDSAGGVTVMEVATSQRDSSGAGQLPNSK